MAPQLDIYSLALLSAMILAAAALLLVLADFGSPRRATLAAAGRISVLSLGFAIFAASFHFAAGHAPGSEEALSAAGFAAAHRTLVGTALLAGGLFVVARGQGFGRGR